MLIGSSYVKANKQEKYSVEYGSNKISHSEPKPKKERV